MESFQTMNLPAELEKALSDLKFINPTEIQSAVIPVALLGCDLMACAETGSGKTAAYGIPIVLQLLKNLEKQALILAPTRELVHQIAEVFRKLTEHCNYIRVTSIVGGTDIRKQLKVLKKKPRIIVATPGRLMDHIRRKSFTIDSRKDWKYYVNVGSVGQPRDGNPHACYVVFDSTTKHICFKRVPYNTEAASKKIAEASLPNELAQRILKGS